MKHDLMMRTLIFLMTCLMMFTALAQAPTGTVRGTVLDTDSRQPLIGATVLVEGSQPLIGATTDLDGRFNLPNLPSGRLDLIVRMLGYEEQRLPNVLVNPAKETVLELSMQTSLVQMAEFEVTSEEVKGRPANDMALVSARKISVEETARTAGGINDPARMVTVFPGVAGDPAGDNTIVVRGNSPRGVLWRMEGVEIPNPNHFSDEGSTGGPISVLNSDVIDDSEFHTGAFTAEFGNATSAVFDMRLRRGNDRKREYTFKLGVLGTDLTAEGPIGGTSGGSYLANYRYSTLSLLDQAGIVDYQGVPKYSDAAFHVVLPTNGLGRFNVWGLGGESHIKQEDRGISEDTLFSRVDFGSRMGVTGIGHTLLVGDRGFLYTTVTLSGNSSSTDYEEDPTYGETGALRMAHRDALSKWTLRGSSVLNYRLGQRHKLRSGIIVSGDRFRLFSEDWDSDASALVKELDNDGEATTLQAFTSWKWRLSERWTLVSGLHAIHYSINAATSLEPRAALSWQQRPDRSFSLALGLHSRTEAIMTYFAERENADGKVVRPNEDLGLAKAAHAVLGFDQQLSEDVQFRAELYYQYLFDQAVENDPSSSFALANMDGWFTTKDLVNAGTGRNYGIEVSVEKFFSRGWHALVTASVSDAKYQAMDGVMRNSRFNMGVVANALAGKEWNVGGPDKNKVLTTGFRYSVVGGQYSSPIDLDASIAEGEQVLGSPAWSEKGDAIHKLDVVIAYRIGRDKVSHELKADVQNVLNASTAVYRYYDARGQRISTVPQLALLPVVQYALRF
ncbi:MAG: TonB-dependent receptor [Flavobacteriales bacterium]|nr:TonB-dependent receptor [Flavobacteriales bacterium]